MITVECSRKGLAVFVAILVLPACTTTVYKDDVKKFSDGVENTTASFDKLQRLSLEENQADHTRRLEKQCKTTCPQLTISNVCSDLVNKTLKDESTCFAQWANFSNSIGGRPKCPQPTGFYSLPAEDAKNCKIGKLTSDGGIDSAGLDLEMSLPNTRKMAAALLAYGTALGDIANSEDEDKLTQSVAELLGAFNGLAGTVTKETGKEQPVLGPLADLLGTALVNILETKRFKAMKSIVNDADPVVTEAAEILSRNSFPLAWHGTIKPALNDLEDAELQMLRARGLNKENFAGRKWKLEAARDAYLNAFVGDASAAYKAMAEAHAALKSEMNDPETQFEHTTTVVIGFYNKSIAVRKALEKSTNKTTLATPAQ